jgi:hypothetical protein
MSLSAESQSAKGAAAAQLVSKTCQNCFSLKIRCDRTQRQDICDRCARLGKNCVFRPARRRDNSARRDSYVGLNPAATHTDTIPDGYRPSNNKYKTFSASKDPAQSFSNPCHQSTKNLTLVFRHHQTTHKMAMSWTRTLCPSSGQRHWSKSTRLT